MNRAIFLLGGNMGDRFGNLLAAIRKLSLVFGPPVNSSSFYLTEPWGKKDQPWFLNITIEFMTGFSPEETLAKTLMLEHEFGRLRTEKWGPRILDIDILYHGETILNTPDLILPHPGIADRRFVLGPLAQMLPDMQHPVLKKTHPELLSRLSTKEVVRKL